MIPSYFKIKILAICDEFVTQWHKGLSVNGLLSLDASHKIISSFRGKQFIYIQQKIVKIISDDFCLLGY